MGNSKGFSRVIIMGSKSKTDSLVVLLYAAVWQAEQDVRQY